MLSIDSGFLITYIEDGKTADLYYKHTDTWKDCEACDLTVPTKVYCRGSLPCEVLFIGEAPGFDEDREGHPFVGRAGEILQTAIDTVFMEFEFTWAVTNTVLCLPTVRLPTGELELRKPLTKHLKRCAERLRGFITICRPKIIVLLGKTAQSKVVYDAVDLAGEELVNFRKGIPIVETPHPAYIARRGGLQSADFQRLILHVTKAVESIL